MTRAARHRYEVDGLETRLQRREFETTGHISMAQLGPALLGLSPGPENEPWWKYVAVDQSWIVVVDYHHDSPLQLSFLSTKDCQTQFLEQAPK